jgi:hypothetical protein
MTRIRSTSITYSRLYTKRLKGFRRIQNPDQENDRRSFSQQATPCYRVLSKRPWRIQVFFLPARGPGPDRIPQVLASGNVHQHSLCSRSISSLSGFTCLTSFLQRSLRQCFSKCFCGAGLLRKPGKDAQTHEALMGKQFEVFFSNYVRLIL